MPHGCHAIRTLLANGRDLLGLIDRNISPESTAIFGRLGKFVRRRRRSRSGARGPTPGPCRHQLLSFGTGVMTMGWSQSVRIGWRDYRMLCDLRHRQRAGAGLPFSASGDARQERSCGLAAGPCRGMRVARKRAATFPTGSAGSAGGGQRNAGRPAASEAWSLPPLDGRRLPRGEQGRARSKPGDAGGGRIHAEREPGARRDRVGGGSRAHRVPALILDGFPRTLAQAESLKKLMENEFLALTAVVNYDLPANEIVARLSGRRTCEKCRRVFHVVERPPKTEGCCDHCGGKLFQREDDRPESIKVRLEVYDRSTAPLIAFYQNLGLLLTVEAHGTPEEIFERTVAGLQNRR
jgi:adenylate kinase family enzyme